MQESFPPEHSRKIFSNPLEHFLDRGRVACESNRHFQALRWDVANTAFDVVGNPFHEMRTIFILDVQHLLVHFLCTHSTAEKCGSSEVATVAWVSSAHHVF